MAAKFIEQREVPIKDLHPHPDNPNRGSVDDLATSLEEFGQYRSIVALQDGTILAGHHLVEAAKRLGLDSIRVEFIEADDGGTAVEALRSEMTAGRPVDFVLMDFVMVPS